MVSPLPPPNYPPSPEQPDPVPVRMESVDKAEEPCQQDQMEDISILETSSAVDKNHSSPVLREVGTESVDEAKESCQPDQREDISIQGAPSSTIVNNNHLSSVLREVKMDTVDQTEESCQQNQREDISIQGTLSSTTVDKTHSSSVLTEPASLEQEAVRQTSSTMIPRPKTKVNVFCSPHFFVSLPFLSLLSLILSYLNSLSSFI